MKYLGVPITFSNLETIDWNFLDAKLIKNLMLEFVIQPFLVLD
jgi:hypothetical protein